MDLEDLKPLPSFIPKALGGDFCEYSILPSGLSLRFANSYDPCPLVFFSLLLLALHRGVECFSRIEIC